MSSENQQISLQAQVPDSLTGIRLDQIAAKLFPDYSRARLQTWIKAGCLLVDGRQLKPRDSIAAGAILTLEAELQAEEDWVAQPLLLNILYEDEHVLVINKSAGVVVHPAAGHREGTLLNGLLSHCPALEQLPRAGIVHRLDKDTTGVMVVAKTLLAHTHLVRELQERNIRREYEAIAKGVLTGGGTIDAPLGRHPVSRKKRAVTEKGQEAVTHYRVIQRYRSHTHVHVQLETGRTHQIRVHMAHINYPLVGDQTYGGRLQIPAASSPQLIEQLQNFKRQALHARRLTLRLPESDDETSWEAVLPADMIALLEAMKADSSQE